MSEIINNHEVDGDTYYKVLVNGKSCNGGDYKYDLPENDEPGEWTEPIDKIKPCERGYHLTNDPRGWLKSDCDIYRAEGRGKEKVCSDDKKVFESVRLLKKVTFNTGIKNSGEFNSGNRNSGNRNSGNRNSGHSNSGNRNSGNGNSGSSNSGYRNSGNRNSGNRNSGHSNSGNRNSGHSNSGNSNSGNSNSGNGNSGSSNSGYRNSGYRNSGNGNSGNWNSGERHTGYFNSGKPETVLVFNKPMDYEQAMDINWPCWFFIKPVEKDNDCEVGSYTEVDYKKAWRESFENASESEVKKATQLPNFDYEVFEEITGISRDMIESKIN